jgi:hypothetical protein
MNTSRFKFQARLWKNIGSGGWHFLSLPKTVAKKIRQQYLAEEEGWGRLKVRAQIGNTDWKTSIWYDTKHKTYLLPINQKVRKKEKVNIDDSIKVILNIPNN